MKGELLSHIEAGDVPGALECVERAAATGVGAWDIHLSLFPLAQRVLNPPFINPHLPKMYRIYRELLPYLKGDDAYSLVRLEVTEYARRPKLPLLPRRELLHGRVEFDAVESAVREDDLARTAVLMASFFSREGAREFARRLLLLGSGHLKPSLGHSVSCTAFMVLEMLDRTEDDLWPCFASLADYFCKGRFHGTLRPRSPGLRENPGDEDSLLRASSGRGIVNLHHTITRYAIERVRHLFSGGECALLIAAWLDFVGDKETGETKLVALSAPQDYPSFLRAFSRLDAESTVSSVRGLIDSPEGRRRLGRLLLKALADLYQGNYNPHYLTGLGSALWVIDHCRSHPAIALNALFQYVDFLFEGLKSSD